ncbi:MAG TPA: hypothetical protein VGQ83_02895 [Polyangia bacterium]|jgi:hypothetical protein
MSTCRPVPASVVVLPAVILFLAGCSSRSVAPPPPDAAASSCADGVKNGTETDVDCGGGGCPACANTRACTAGSDCQSGVCTNQVCVAPASSCADGARSGTETDVDCGGGACPACANGKSCTAGTDCQSGLCASQVCAAPPSSCADGVKNGTETDVDCGGGCPPCGVGQFCHVAADCQGGRCQLGLCAGPPSTCGDLVVDYAQGEQCDDGMQCDDGTSCTLPAACAGIGTGACLPRGGDGCSATCQIETVPTCGNGVVDVVAGEQCDDGKQCEDGSSCVSSAQCAGIGAGTCAPRDGDGCSAACHFELVGQTCGDQAVQSPEVCDLGTARNGDTCDLTLTPACACGSTPCGCNATCNLTATSSLFAGTPHAAGRADGDRLTQARFGGDVTLAISDTHLFVADFVNNVIRRVDLASGVVQTIAGDAAGGAAGYADNADGLAARFNSPQSMTTDGTTLWVGDEGNHVVRAIALTSPTFAVTTVAGQQWSGSPNTACPDAAQRSAGRCYLDSATASSALFHGLRGITYHGGTLYLCDETAGTLRALVPGGGVATAAGVAYQNAAAVDGVGAAGRLVSPRYIAADGSGMLYLAETNGYLIRSFNPRTGYLGTFAGTGIQGYRDGVGTAAILHRPRGITSDGTSLYWVEFNAGTIRQAELATGKVTTLVGTPANANCPAPGPVTYAEGVGNAAVLNCPYSAVYHYPSRSLFFADGGNDVIRQIR